MMFMVFTEFYWVSPNKNGFCRVLQGITGSYRVLLGFTRSLLGSVGFARFPNAFHGLYRVLLGFIPCEWVLSCFTGYYR